MKPYSYWHKKPWHRISGNPLMEVGTAESDIASNGTDAATRLPLFEKNAFGLLFFFIAFMPIIGHGGGLGLAPIALILAILGGILLFTQKRLSRPPLWFWALMAFLSWLMITALWSPYPLKGFYSNPTQLFMTGLLFPLAIPLFKAAAERNRTIFAHVWMAFSLFGAGLVVIDLLSGYGLSLLFDPLNPGELIENRQADAEMNIGHGVTLLVISAVPVAYLMRHHIPKGLYLAVLFLMLLIYGAVLTRLSVGIAALLAALGCAILARLFPRFTIYALFGLAIMLIAGAPALAYLAGNMPVETLQGLPLSWEHRLRMWAYCGEVIAQNPLWGDGFDSVRTYGDTFTSKQGWDVVIVSLHPHNTGLQIWTESGAVGAALAILTLFLLIKPALNFAQSRPRAVGLAGFIAAFIVICSLTYGAWQYWWWGALFYGIGLLHFLPEQGQETPALTG